MVAVGSRAPVLVIRRNVLASAPPAVPLLFESKVIVPIEFGVELVPERVNVPEI